MREVIFTEGDFTLVKESGIGMNETPWEGLCVLSDGDAKDFVVEVRLTITGLKPYNGEPVKNTYTGEVTVAHGMSMRHETLADTERYVEVLKNAVVFARRVEKWLIDNDEWLR